MSSEGAAVPAPPAKKGPGKLWLPIVLGIGTLVGALLSSYIQYIPSWLLGPDGYRLSLEIRDALVVQTILSTTIIALLVALGIVYVKVYMETRAMFALGIVAVMGALLIQSLLQYPLVLGLFAQLELAQAPYLSFGDLFSIAAYSVFLYLSLD